MTSSPPRRPGSSAADQATSRSFALLEGLRPLDANQVPRDVVAGITLAALAIPEVMGDATIAGMPITGLYSIVLPVFALLERFGALELLGPDGVFDTVDEVVDHVRHATTTA